MDACSRPHSYLLLDLKQDKPDDFRFRTCVFPDDKLQYTYVPCRGKSTRR
ncbi:hypothetical protein TSAR_014692 [Trichomalopsis sarcophagae]|uniref:Uncharacterized protein n=1 Tax=Trichomalopsis sarcophagae TaxID=543379 RepID=A0A232EQX3_9HYME|nr:hypothetical protein TSAR_014692 [Trichomalopsis sarcophagae]